MSTRRPWKFRTAPTTAILAQPDAMRLDVPFVVLDNPCFGNAVIGKYSRMSKSLVERLV
jgi:hypothetical protein